MSVPELSSRRKIQSVPLESERNPKRVPNGTRDGYGMGRGVEVVPLSVKWEKRLLWAEKHLPNEHPGFVCVALGTMRRAGTPISAQSVLAHLEASGRDRKSTDAVAARYERKLAA